MLLAVVIGVPVTSSVSYVVPRRRVAIYPFSSLERYSAAFAALPIKITKTPVAIGSRVPV